MTRTLATYVALWTLVATAVATGIVVGLLVAHAILPDAVAASRAAPESIPAVSRPVAGSVTLDDLAQRGQPEPAVIPAPTGLDSEPSPGRITPSPATSTRAAPAEEPRTATTLRGVATWYDSTGGAAAGPDLRAALGPGWRGQVVTVTRADLGAAVKVRLTDFCACGARNGVPTLIDLDRESFAVLALPSRGVVTVEIRP